MSWAQHLPTLNALLNATAASFLLAGYLAIRRGEREAHKRHMITAFAVSVLFLISYSIYHATMPSTPFTAQGIIRPIYFFILISHIILAAAVPVLALITLSRGLKARFEKHRRIARWTWPIWMYVSVTGVLIYLLLYVLFPSGAA